MSKIPPKLGGLLPQLEKLGFDFRTLGDKGHRDSCGCGYIREYLPPRARNFHNSH
jgi:hypothetical protein